MLILKGDCHGDFSCFDFAEGELTKDDVIVVLGDCGLMWPGWEEETVKYLDRTFSDPYTVIFIFGNHDNYDWAETLSKSNMFGGTVRPIEIGGKLYPHRFVVDDTTILDLCGEHCLLIPHADSHDVAGGIFEPDDIEGIEEAKRGFYHFRIKHQTWWEQEKLNIPKTEAFLTLHKDEHFDAILTHDCPALFCSHGRGDGGARFKPTPAEEYLETLRQTLDFDVWAHGHMHFDFVPYSGKWEHSFDGNLHHVRKMVEKDKCFCLYNCFIPWHCLKNWDGDRGKIDIV